MRRLKWLVFACLLPVVACAPEQAGQQIGQSLYDASVNTGRAIANFGDRTGAALQNAGTNLRNGVNPPPAYPAPLPPPVYTPDDSYAPPPDAGGWGTGPRPPVTATPLD